MSSKKEKTVAGDRKDGRPKETDKNDARRGGGGGENLQFLDLEVSKALRGDASRLAGKAFRKVLTQRIMERLEEQLGPRLDALAKDAADDLIADLEANLDIEERIRERGKLREERASTFRSRFLEDDEDSTTDEES